MIRNRLVVQVLSCLPGALWCGAHWAQAQDYPSRTVRVVTAEIGGGTDLPLRVITPGLATALGQPVVVENRGNVVLSVDVAAKAAADGYTLLMAGNSMWTLPLMRTRMNYDMARDFTPITLAIITPTILVVHPSVPVSSVKDLVALAKSRPGQLNYASSATGTGNHMAMELFKSLAGIDLVRVAYKGHASALNATVAGEAQVFFPIAGPGMAQAKAGRLKALAVTTMQPSPLAPGLPTMASAGLPGYESVFRAGLFAPAGTAEAIVNRLNREIVRIVQRPEIREKLLAMGMETIGNTPQEFSAVIAAEVAQMGKVIREAGIRDE